jgi:excisionase family DNA binding protein
MATLKELEGRRELLTAEELAALLNVSEKTVYRWGKSGSLPSVRLGAAVRFEPAVVSVWLRERGAAAQRG